MELRATALWMSGIGPEAEGQVEFAILLERAMDGRRRRQIAQTEVAPEPSAPAKPLVVKLLTDDPNIVIYWLIDNTGGAL